MIVAWNIFDFRFEFAEIFESAQCNAETRLRESQHIFGISLPNRTEIQN
jgi:hypothetical protein